mmetsp:Transcript_2044/g.13215  ORF Transcript_2044/g.13215 Transcript_2044/m.13215 type:complete len:118 (+) Transcript_2044:3038-3391(+)
MLPSIQVRPREGERAVGTANVSFQGACIPIDLPQKRLNRRALPMRERSSGFAQRQGTMHRILRKSKHLLIYDPGQDCPVLLARRRHSLRNDDTVGDTGGVDGMHRGVQVAESSRCHC